MLRNTAAFNGYLAATGSSGPAVAIMESPSTLGYRVYQTPSFSYAINTIPGSYTNASLGCPQDGSGVLQYGNINVGNISSETGANDTRSVMSVTFRNEWGSGLEPGAGNYIMAFIQEANFNQTGKSGFWSLNSFTQFRDNLFAITGRQESDYGINRAAETLSGDYEDYNYRWLTFISAEAETSSVYENWNPISGNSGDTTFARTCVWDTETQTLLQTLDISFTPSEPFIQFLDYESLGNVPTTRQSVDDGITFQMSGTDQYQREPVRFYNAWASFGNMWDPANPPDTSIFTTRPSETIGNTQAWLNIQFVEYTTNTGSDDYFYLMDQGDSRYSQSSDIAMRAYAGNITVINNAVSTTTIPKDRNI